MHRAKICALFLIASLMTATAAAPGDKLQPGVEAQIDIALLGGPMKVFLPANYDRSARWPLIFFYPGQDQQPSTALIRKFADERDYIIVGLPYPDAGPSPSSRDAPPHYAERLLSDLDAARSWISSNATIDAKRIFIGGVSKGGWTATLIGEPGLADIAGLIILLAGRGYPMIEEPGKGNYRLKQIYIGAGEFDPNMRAARQANEFFIRHGSTTFFEEFRGAGHEVPADAPRLRAWMRVHGPLWNARTNDLPEIGLWLTNSLAEVNALTGSVARLNKLFDIVHDARYPLCSRSDYSLVRDLLTTTASIPPAREEWFAERDYRGMLWKETKIASLEDMRLIRDGYLAISTNYPGTRFGRFAAADHKAVDQAYQQSLEATRKIQAQTGATPAAAATVTNDPTKTILQPKSDRPTGVKIEGNKIKFQR